MIRKRNEADNFLENIAGPAIAQEESRLRTNERKKDHSSESFEDEGGKKERRGEEVDRSNKAKDERRMLDGNRCIILGSGRPDVCHILPFSLNAKEEQRRKLRGYLGPAIFCIFSETPKWVDGPAEISPDNLPEGSETGSEMEVDDDAEIVDVISKESPDTLFAIFCRKIFASRTGVSDKAWNEICLSPQLHDWWGQGFFALEPLGVDGKFQSQVTNDEGHVTTYTRIKVQFHWMPRHNDLSRTISQGISAEALSSLVGKTFGDLDRTDDSNPVFKLDRNVSLSHWVETGDIFYVKVEFRCADRMLAAFQIQWAAINILAMAGGAAALDDVGDHPDYLDEDLHWLGDLKMSELMKEWENQKFSPAAPDGTTQGTQDAGVSGSHGLGLGPLGSGPPTVRLVKSLPDIKV